MSADPTPPSPTTATLSNDIVNRFAEAVMILDMAVDEPSALDDLLPWVPVGYGDHFEAVGSVRAEEALDAYAGLPDDWRAALDGHVALLDGLCRQTLEDMRGAEDRERRAAIREEAAPRLHDEIARLHHLIATGTPDAAAEADPQASIDDLFRD